MYKHVLLPTDGSKLSAKGTRETLRMARALGAKVTAIHVVGSYHQRWQDADDGFTLPELPALRKEHEDRAVARADAILRPVKEAADKAGQAAKDAGNAAVSATQAGAEKAKAGAEAAVQAAKDAAKK